MIHYLKTWPPYFEAVLSGAKTFEVRKADRPFQVGHYLHLQEWDPKTKSMTGREICRCVTYILPGGQFGVEAGHVVMGLGVSPCGGPEDI